MTVFADDNIYTSTGAIREEDNVVRDTDEDGLPDYYEKLINTGELKLGNGMCLWDFPDSTQLSWADPNNQDSDGDGIPDGYEIEIHAHPDTEKPYIYVYSNPCMADSDGDGLIDSIDSHPFVFNYYPVSIVDGYMTFNTGNIVNIEFVCPAPSYYFWSGVWPWFFPRDGYSFMDAVTFRSIKRLNEQQTLSPEEFLWFYKYNPDNARVYADGLKDNTIINKAYKLRAAENGYSQEIIDYRWQGDDGWVENHSFQGNQFWYGKVATNAEIEFTYFNVIKRVDCHAVNAMIVQLPWARFVNSCRNLKDVDDWGSYARGFSWGVEKATTGNVFHQERTPTMIAWEMEFDVDFAEGYIAGVSTTECLVVSAVLNAVVSGTLNVITSKGIADIEPVTAGELVYNAAGELIFAPADSYAIAEVYAGSITGIIEALAEMGIVANVAKSIVE